MLRHSIFSLESRGSLLFLIIVIAFLIVVSAAIAVVYGDD